jgi:ribosome biogenesis GTPase
VDRDSLEAGFPEIEVWAGQCRFRDCRHDDEPGCAVRAALERGDIPAGRFAAFQKLRAEIASLESAWMNGKIGADRNPSAACAGRSRK